MGEAAEGFDAVEMCRTSHPDIALLDVRMPVFDGLYSAENIISEGLAGCVVLLTAFSDREIVTRASELGVSGYLVKPVDEKLLMPTLEVAYGQSMRLKKSRNETKAAEQKADDLRIIYKAQSILALKNGITETEAYKYMRKKAMDQRISVAELAKTVIGSGNEKAVIDAVKKKLMSDKGMSESAAYKYVEAYARKNKISVFAAAKLLSEDGVK